MSRYLVIALTAVSHLVSSSAIAGHALGNGAEYLSVWHDASWFTGRKGVSVCIQKSPDFPTDRQALEQAFLSAHRKWKQYYEEKQTAANAARLGISFTLDMRRECVGNEELTIFAGTTNQRVEAGRVQMVNPLAFALLEDFTLTEGRGRGLIWIAAQPRQVAERFRSVDWTTGTYLETILLHELGHVFGVPHIAETVMRKDISDYLATMDANNPATIDQKEVLFRSQKISETYEADKEQVARTMTGMSKILGNQAGEVEYATLYVNNAENGNQYTLFFYTPSRILRVPFRIMRSEAIDIKDYSTPFKRVKKTGERLETVEEPRTRTVVFGEVASLEGESSHSAALILNLGSHVTLQYFDLEEKRMQTLFSGKSTYRFVEE